MPEQPDRIPAPHLRFVDAVSIIVGIVIGTAIFKTPTLVLQNVSGEWQACALWLLGGLLSLCGALCYAELATSFSRSGGEYIYLSRAYGPWLGFLFGWAQLTAIHSGTVGSLAYAFADYAMKLRALPEETTAWLAAGSIIVLTLLNLSGVTTGRTVQNILSAAKIVGLLLLIVAGFAVPVAAARPAADAIPPQTAIGLALVFVLYAYGGWNDTAFVAAEVKDRRRNIPRALIAGISGITVIYLLVNFACVRALGIDGVRATYTPAADVVETLLGPAGSKGISLLVMICALGAINAMIFTGSRVYAAMTQDLRLFNREVEQPVRNQIPWGALLAPGLFACLLILAVGTQRGQLAVDIGLSWLGIPALPWNEYFGGFDTLVAGTAPVFWLFFLLSGFSVFLLRRVPPDCDEPFRVPWYPLPPLLFCSMCGYMLYSSIAYAKWLSLLGFAPLVPGLVLYLYHYHTKSR